MSIKTRCLMPLNATRYKKGLPTLIAVFCFLMSALPVKSNEIPIAVSGEPTATLQIGAKAS